MFAFAELKEFAEQKLKNFSSGMQVRLAFSVAILGRPTCWSWTSPGGRRRRLPGEMLRHLQQVQTEGKTIVLVSHDLGSLEEYCDRVLLLNQGAIVADGPAAEVVATYHRMVADHALALERVIPVELSQGDRRRSPAVGFESVGLLTGAVRTPGASTRAAR